MAHPARMLCGLCLEGVEAVIAKSFAFICMSCVARQETNTNCRFIPDERNQLNMGLFNAILLADDFYEHAQEGGGITIDRNSRTIALDGIAETFSYTHTVVEETLLDAGGILPLYARYGRQLFREITSNKSQKASESAVARGLFEESRTRETLVVISSTS